MARDAQKNHRCFSIVPAAGHSRRMGTSKLLLPFPLLASKRDETKVIDSVLHAWTASRVAHVVVVMRSDDHELREACDAWPIHAVVPDADPVDMKQSLQIGMRYIENHFSPTDDDACFIAPADLPTLTRHVIDGLIDSVTAGRTGSSIFAPKFGEKSGHPALVPWAVAQEIFTLPTDQGVDFLVRRNDRRYVEFPDALRVEDIDTLDDYERLLEETHRRIESAE